ncbi:MAG: hypothetical protein U0R50_12130 [Gaiellales bacterium]
MTAIGDERHPPELTREGQEREIALEHLLTEVEHALAIEAAAVAEVLAEVGIPLDPLTFVALRLISESSLAGVDPTEFLHELHRRGVLERAATTAAAVEFCEPAQDGLDDETGDFPRGDTEPPPSR